MNDDAFCLLDSLGDTVEIVASRLRTEGVKGCGSDPNNCVLARFLQRHGHELHVHPDSGGPFGEVCDTNGVWACNLPQPCNQLAAEFDDGLHPDLMEDTGVNSRFDWRRVSS